MTLTKGSAQNQQSLVELCTCELREPSTKGYGEITEWDLKASSLSGTWGQKGQIQFSKS